MGLGSQLKSQACQRYAASPKDALKTKEYSNVSTTNVLLQMQNAQLLGAKAAQQIIRGEVEMSAALDAELGHGSPPGDKGMQLASALQGVINISNRFTETLGCTFVKGCV